MSKKRDYNRARDAAHKRAKEAKALYDGALRSKYKPNAKTAEIIGLQLPTLTHITTDAVPGTLTQTTFDTTSRADSAQILLTNSTGSEKTIIAAWIRGKPVTRNSGARSYVPTVFGEHFGGGGGTPGYVSGGFLHDKFVDYEAQARDGDITFETGNNWVVTADQVNKLADYYWKLNKTKKHIYTLSLVGFQTWYEPGEWYTLDIGAEGTAENILSTVECFDVRCSIAAGGVGYTSVSFREVEELWKFDSNEVARKIASGDFSRRPSQTMVTVAAQYYAGYADYYCDGTDDQEEINKALSYLSKGGTVQLTGGTFNIATAITFNSNNRLTGEGPGTIIYKRATGLAWTIDIGVNLSSITNIGLDNFAMNTVNKTTGYHIAIANTNTLIMENVVMLNPATISAYIQNSSNFMLINNVQKNIDSYTTYSQAYGIYISNSVTSYSNIISNNIIADIRSSGAYDAIYINDIYSQGAYQIANNQINNCVSNAGWCYGVHIKSNRNLLSSNKITNMKSATSISVIGYYIETSMTNNVLVNNFAFNNGDDTGFANTNGDNYLDGGTSTLLDQSSWV